MARSRPRRGCGRSARGCGCWSRLLADRRARSRPASRVRRGRAGAARLASSAATAASRGTADAVVLACPGLRAGGARRRPRPGAGRRAGRRSRTTASPSSPSATGGRTCRPAGRVRVHRPAEHPARRARRAVVLVSIFPDRAPPGCVLWRACAAGPAGRTCSTGPTTTLVRRVPRARCNWPDGRDAASRCSGTSSGGRGRSRSTRSATSTGWPGSRRRRPPPRAVPRRQRLPRGRP